MRATTKTILRATGAALGASLLLTGCGSGDGGGATGQLTVGVTDAPVDMAQSITVQFTGITVKPKDGEAEVIQFPDDNDDGQPDPKTLTLTDLTAGKRAVLLDNVTVAAGDYNWVRLHVQAEQDGVEDSTITLQDGSVHELSVPSGAETGLKLVGGISVPDGGTEDVTVDFDLRKSVHQTGTGEYVLRPTLRLVDTDGTGSIAGTIGDQFLTDNSCDPATDHAAVYIFEGDVSPDDYTDRSTDNQDVDPLTTARPAQDNSTWSYQAAYLEPGTYTVTFTCQADQDFSDSDDALTFAGTGTADVTAGGTTDYPFAASP
ncbi:MAG TPA: DUF4382 domain-containing protein [Gammaproteobacteria bacterium]|nr:DUF4382 domain-containing protein [Gammaproteobacteria bacterium]